MFFVFIFRLRIRVKALQAVVESQSNRLASLAAEKDIATLGRQDESTGQGSAHMFTYVHRCVYIQNYVLAQCFHNVCAVVCYVLQGG